MALIRLPAALRRAVLAGGIALGLVAVPMPFLHVTAFAVDPVVSPAPSPSDVVASSAPPSASADPSPSATPPATPDPSPSLDPSPSPAPSASPNPSPSPSPDPSAGAGPDPTATPPPPTPTPSPAAPDSLNLYVASGFRFQDPYMTSCTAAAAEDMLNFIALGGSGGSGLVWGPTLSNASLRRILAFERANDTLAPWAAGSDPHGWRNALNFYGWGASAMSRASWVYVDQGFTTFNGAIRAAVRAMIDTHKPVGMLGWGGRHAQILTGYFGLQGDPFAKKPDGTWADTFTVGGLYLSDPLRRHGWMNVPVSVGRLAAGTNWRIRFTPYVQRDSIYHDPLVPGIRRAWREWYGLYTLILPIR